MTTQFEFIQVLRQITKDQMNTSDFDNCLISGSSYTSKQKKRKIKNVIITTELNKNALIEALRKKIDLILIYNFENWERQLIDENLEMLRHLIEKNIIIYKIPESWSSSEGGLNEIIAEILKLEIEDVFNIKLGKDLVSYGRICSPFKSQIRYSLILNLIKDKLALTNFPYLISNELEDIIQKCLILVGKNAKVEWLKKAKMRGIDLILGNGLNHTIARFADSIGINFIDLTYKTISYGLNRLSNILSLECPDVQFAQIDSSLQLNFFTG
ncbi:MAG: Nif3-like dinuclear metal center hexameric protein [Candidatus Helarchaeota archaeon]